VNVGAVKTHAHMFEIYTPGNVYLKSTILARAESIPEIWGKLIYFISDDGHFINFSQNSGSIRMSGRFHQNKKYMDHQDHLCQAYAFVQM